MFYLQNSLLIYLQNHSDHKVINRAGDHADGNSYHEKTVKQPIASNHALSALMAAAMGAAGLGLAFTYYSSRHYFRNAEFLSLGKESTFIDLGIALPPGSYHSRASLALKDTLMEVLQAADG